MAGTANLVLQFTVTGTAASLQQVNQLQSGIEAAATKMNALWASPIAAMSSGIDSLVSKIETGLTRTLIAGTAAAGGFAFAMAGIGRSFIEVNQKFAEFEITLASSLKSLTAARTIVDQVARVTAQSPLPFKDIASSITGLSILPQLNQQFSAEAANNTLGQANSLFMRSKQLVEMMNTFRPDKSPEEAVFSIREALTGQWRSILRRFDVPLSIFSDAEGGKSISRITQEGPNTIMDSMFKAFSNIVSPDAIKQRAQMPSVALDNIYEQMFQIPALQVGRSGFMDNLGKRLNKYLDDSLGFFGTSANGTPGQFESLGFAKKMSDSLSNILDSFLDGLGKAANAVLNSFGYGDQSQSIYKRAAQAISDGLDSFSQNLPRYIDEAISVGKDLLELAKGVWSVFKEIASGFIDAYHTLQPILGTGGTLAALYLAPGAILNAVGGGLKGILGQIGTAVTGQFAAAINPLTALATGQGFLSTGAAGGAMRLTPAAAAQMGTLGMTSAAGRAYRGGQLVSQNVMNAATGAAGAALPEATFMAGLTAFASFAVALVGLTVTIVEVTRAISAYKDMTTALAQVESTRADLMAGLNSNAAQLSNQQQMSSQFAGIQQDPVMANLQKQQSIALGAVKNYGKTWNPAFLDRVQQLVPGADPYKDDVKGGLPMTLDDQMVSLSAQVVHYFSLAMQKELQTNPELAQTMKTASDSFKSALQDAAGFKGVNSVLDTNHVPLGAGATGTGGAATARALLKNKAFQDDTDLLEGDLFSNYLKAAQQDLKDKYAQVDKINDYLNTSQAEQEFNQVVVDARALQTLLSASMKNPTALAGTPFKTVDEVKSKLGSLQSVIDQLGSTGVNPFRSEAMKSRGQYLNAIGDGNRNINMNTKGETDTNDLALLAQMQGAANSPNFLAFLNTSKMFGQRSGVPNQLASSLQSTQGMMPFQTLTTNISNASSVTKAYNDEVESLIDQLAKASGGKEETDLLNKKLALAQEGLAKSQDSEASARYALTEAIRANSTQLQKLASDDALKQYTTSRTKGYSFSTSYNQDFFGKQAVANGNNNGVQGFNQGFGSQFMQGDDWKNMAQGGIDAANALKTSFGSAFSSILTGQQSMSAGFKSVVLSVDTSIETMIAKMIVLALWQEITGFFLGSGNISAAADSSVQSGSFSQVGSLAGGSSGGSVWNGRIGSNMIYHLAAGGGVRGGSGNRDDIPAMLMDGEYVLSKKATAEIGKAQLDAWNHGSGFRHFSMGGSVGSPGGSSPFPTASNGGQVNVVVNYNATGNRNESATGSSTDANKDDEKYMKMMRQEIETMVIKTVDKYERMKKAQSN